MNYSMWIFLMVFLLAVAGLEFQENSNSCIKNSDCRTKKAICSDGQCSCDNISYNATGSHCLSYVTEYMGYCEEQKQCEWLGSDSDCIENQCVCRKNYQWFQGSCQYLAGKGTSCKSSTECVDRHDVMSMQCSSDTGKCTCAEGYYDRGSDCRQKSSVGNACALDIDCQSTELSCTLGKCTATNKTVEMLSYDIEYSTSAPTETTTPSDVYGNIDCSFDNDCLDMANSFCNVATGKCVCNENTHYLHEGNCLPGFGFCQETTHCANWTNSFCFKNSCVCSRGFFLHEGNCIAEIGMPDPSLKSDKDCVIKPGKLVKPAGIPTCVCKTYWSSDDANRNCIKTMIQDISSCLSNDWCDAMGPYSFCNSSTKKCQCSRFATLDESNYYCVKTDGGCLKDSGCKINEKCIDEECKCIENYSRHNNVCLPDIGGHCDIALCTHISNSGCAQGVCQCYPNYVGQKNSCYKVAESLNDTCEIDEQCQNIKYSKCDSENDQKKTCICKGGYTKIDDYCLEKKEYGDACMKHTDCTLVLNHSFECRKSRCQCPLGRKLKDGYCTSSSTKYSVAISLLLLSMISLCVNII